jgi:hypothetical protein
MRVYGSWVCLSVRRHKPSVHYFIASFQCVSIPCRVGAEMCSMGSMTMIREQTQKRQTKTEFEKAEKDSKKYQG